MVELLPTTTNKVLVQYSLIPKEGSKKGNKGGLLFRGTNKEMKGQIKSNRRCLQIICLNRNCIQVV